MKTNESQIPTTTDNYIEGHTLATAQQRRLLASAFAVGDPLLAQWLLVTFNTELEIVSRVIKAIARTFGNYQGTMQHRMRLSKSFRMHNHFPFLHHALAYGRHQVLGHC